MPLGVCLQCCKATSLNTQALSMILGHVSGKNVLNTSCNGKCMLQVSAALRILAHLDEVAPDYVYRMTGSLVKLFVVIQADHKQHSTALLPIPGCARSDTRAGCLLAGLGIAAPPAGYSSCPQCL